jgi:hypothetical protein
MGPFNNRTGIGHSLNDIAKAAGRSTCPVSILLAPKITVEQGVRKTHHAESSALCELGD